MHIAANILELATTAPEGTVLTAKSLLHFGSRAAVDQALSRLARTGALLRIGRGVYVAPVRSRFGTYAPSPPLVMTALSAVTGETIVPGMGSAANVLGFTTQNPVRYVYLTSGRGRRLQVGGHEVELQHAPAWLLGGVAARALASFGPLAVRSAARQLRPTLPTAERERLLRERSLQPTWLAEAVSEVFAVDA